MRKARVRSLFPTTRNYHECGFRHLGASQTRLEENIQTKASGLFITTSLHQVHSRCLLAVQSSQFHFKLTSSSLSSSQAHLKLTSPSSPSVTPSHFIKFTSSAPSSSLPLLTSMHRPWQIPRRFWRKRGILLAKTGQTTQVQTSRAKPRISSSTMSWQRPGTTVAATTTPRSKLYWIERRLCCTS